MLFYQAFVFHPPSPPILILGSVRAGRNSLVVQHFVGSPRAAQGLFAMHPILISGGRGGIAMQYRSQCGAQSGATFCRCAVRGSLRNLCVMAFSRRASMLVECSTRCKATTYTWIQDCVMIVYASAPLRPTNKAAPLRASGGSDPRSRPVRPRPAPATNAWRPTPATSSKVLRGSTSLLPAQCLTSSPVPYQCLTSDLPMPYPVPYLAHLINKHTRHMRSILFLRGEIFVSAACAPCVNL